MSTKIIYLIRHGETEFNRQGIVQGSGVDSDLNETGFAQARAFYEFYKDIKFDKIYTSNLRRTVQTVQNFIEDGIPYEQLEGLNEICWGVKEGKAPNYLEDAFYLEVIKQWREGETYIPAAEGGESPDEVAHRQRNSIEIILSKPEEETILIAMHGRAIRILLAQIVNNSLATMDDFEHRNVCLYKLKYSYHNNTFEIELANDVSHLEEIMA